MRKRVRDIRNFIQRAGGTGVSIKINGCNHLKVAFDFENKRAHFTFPQTPQGGGELYKKDIKKFMRTAQGNTQ